MFLKMKNIYVIMLLLLYILVIVEGKKLSKSRSSSSNRGSRKTNYNPQPTSLSYPQPSAPKPSLFGWQEKPAQRTQTSQSKQSKPSNSQSHSYPSSQTGLSGNTNRNKPTVDQDSVQKTSQVHTYPSQAKPQINSQQGHSYPSSNGLSGSPGTGAGAGYPQQQNGGLSGAAPSYNSGNNYASNTRYQGPPAYSNNNGLSGSAPGYNRAGGAQPPYTPNTYGSNYHHPQGPPPPYTNYGGYGGQGSYNPQMPGYFGNYGHSKGFGSVGRSSNVLTGVGIAGAGVGTILTGLALWNLARSTGHHHHTVIYDNRGQPVAVAANNDTEMAANSILGDLVNCTLTISSDNATEVLAIPCAIATSFTPDADIKDKNSNGNQNDNTNCTVTVITKEGKEFMTTIACSILLNTAAENNVTEAPPDQLNIANETLAPQADTHNHPSALMLAGGENNTSMNCSPEAGEIRDPINPCFAVINNLTVIPLKLNDSSSLIVTTPESA